MIKNNIIVLAMALTTGTIYAQQTTSALGEYRFDDATQLWRLTNNAAGLGIDTTRNRGYAQIGYEHHSGDYHRVQEGSRTNQLHFYTERYQKVGKYIYGYGRFEFDYGGMSDRSWSDVRRSYNSNPYFFGSAIKARYDFQNFDFTAALASVKIKKYWNFGLKFDYKTGDLSRLRDPRSRTSLLDYKITPAIMYSFGRNTFGLSGNYHRRKEKIDVTTLQTNSGITYYAFTGMEYARGVVDGHKDAKREWVDHRFGGELTYGYKSNNYNLLVAASIDRGTEYTWGDNEKQEGKYVGYKYGLKIKNRLRSDKKLHELDLTLLYDQSYADEYRQKFHNENSKESTARTYQYIVRKDDGTYETRDSTITKVSDEHYDKYYETQLVMKKRYQVNVFNLDVHYRLNFVDNNSINGYAGFRFAMQDSRNKYLLPTSTLRYNSFDTTLEGGLSVLKGRLWFDGAFTYRGVGKAELDLADPTTDYAINVLIPDMEYYKAKFIKGSLAVTYNFPIKIKRKNTSWYVRANGDWLRTNSNLHASSFGVTLGMFN